MSYDKICNLSICSIIFSLLFLSFNSNLLGSDKEMDSIMKARKLLQDAKVESSKKEIKMTIQNVDISRYPTVKLIVEAYNVYGEPLDTLTTENLSVMENGVERQVISVEKISINERVPVDFVFVIDKTGTMQTYIDAVRDKIRGLIKFLSGRGIDYRLGLILFSDEVEKTYEPTEDINDFLRWLSRVRAEGGGDIKENALEALDKATYMDYRPSANRVVVMVTDAPYHQAGETGMGKTKHTTGTIIQQLNDNNIRVFGIVPSKLKDYETIALRTRGNVYDIDFPFSTILDNFSTQLTNLYALVYKTTLPAIPDSIDVAIINEKKQQLTSKTIPIVELGRKLIIENMLYMTGSANLPSEIRELNVLTEFMKNKKNVVIQVEGHTDSVGSHEVNDRLSKLRAESVKSYLINKGISPNRIQTIGYGKRRPIASNNTEFGRKLNRRTEILIIAK